MIHMIRIKQKSCFQSVAIKATQSCLKKTGTYESVNSSHNQWVQMPSFQLFVLCSRSGDLGQDLRIKHHKTTKVHISMRFWPCLSVLFFLGRLPKEMVKFLSLCPNCAPWPGHRCPSFHLWHIPEFTCKHTIHNSLWIMKIYWNELWRIRDSGCDSPSVFGLIHIQSPIPLATAVISSHIQKRSLPNHPWHHRNLKQHTQTYLGLQYVAVPVISGFISHTCMGPFFLQLMKAISIVAPYTHKMHPNCNPPKPQHFKTKFHWPSCSEWPAMEWNIDTTPDI